MNIGSFETEREPRRGRWAAVLLILAYGAVVGVANLWVARAYEPSWETAVVAPEAVIELPAPQVLHRSVVSLPGPVVAVPYQAGAYELTAVLPVQFTTVYKHANAEKEGRVVLFAEPVWRRLELLAAYPGSALLAKAETPRRLAAVIADVGAPTLVDRLLPWRVVARVARSQVRELLVAEGGGSAMSRFWQVATGDATAVGREYPLVRRTGQRIAVTVFKNERAYDLLFAFDYPDADNYALVRAWIEALDPTGIPRPKNEQGLAECSDLPNAGPNQAAVSTCQKIHLTAAWVSNRYDARVAERLAELLITHGDIDALGVMAAQLALLADEEAKARRVVKRIGEAIERLNAQREAAAAAEEKTKTESENHEQDV